MCTDVKQAVTGLCDADWDCEHWMEDVHDQWRVGHWYFDLDRECHCSV